MTDFTFALQRLLNTPLACTEDHAMMIVAAIHGRFNFSAFESSTGQVLDQVEMTALAARGRNDAAARRTYREQGKIFHQQGSVALIPVHGTLTQRTAAMDPESGQTGYNRIEQKVDEAVNDPDIAGIMLDVDSGGGEAAGMADLADFIHARRFRSGGPKPIYARANAHAYSAAYFLLSAADKSFVPETGGAGSIGTLALIPNISGKMEKEGVSIKVMRSGANKARINGIEEPDDESLARVQADLDSLRAIFVDRVARNMGISKKSVLETQAESYMGGRAKTLGLVNAVASPLEAMAELQRKISR